MSTLRFGRAALGLVLASAALARAQDAPVLPVQRVVLFSSGVGYFERAGRVQGAATVPLSFRTEQVNDVLKSLVVLDPAGRVEPIVYGGVALAGGRVSSGRLENYQALTLGAVLREFQGAQVRLELEGRAVEGRILSVAQRSRPGPPGHGLIPVEVVNVLTTDGVQAVEVESVARVRFLDERLDRELRAALESRATGLDDQRRKVELRFGDAGAREVRAGYLQEMPVWKTTYRLVLDEGERPYLQGWGIIENTTDEDWSGVRLSLISGRPVSFIQNLYQPLFIPRPEVDPQVGGSPVPQTYGEALEPSAPATREARAGGVGGMGGMGGGIGGFGGGFGGASSGVRGPAGGEEPKITMHLQAVPLRTALQQIFASSGLQYAVDPNVPNVPINLNLYDSPLTPALRMLVRLAAFSVPGLTFTRDGDVFTIRVRQARLSTTQPTSELPPEQGMTAEDISRSVGAQAAGQARGELFEYRIDQPVSLKRGDSAMVPIAAAPVDGERVSLYDPTVDAERAMRGFRLRNSTGLHLSAGPVTVFQGGVYGGDAQIGYVGPGEDRLLSYAVDLDLVAGSEAPRTSQETTTVKAVEGVLQVTRRQQRESAYTFRNKSGTPKTVLVELPVEPNFKLVEPVKPEERTASAYRFKVAVPARGSGALKVVTQRPVTESLALASIDLTTLEAYAQNAQLSEPLRAALKHLTTLRQRLSAVRSKRAALDQEIKTIDQEQTRIRQNMGVLDRNNPLYQQYVKKLAEQETRIEAIRAESARLLEQEEAADQAIKDYLGRLTLE